MSHTYIEDMSTGNPAAIQLRILLAEIEVAEAHLRALLEKARELADMLDDKPTRFVNG